MIGLVLIFTIVPLGKSFAARILTSFLYSVSLHAVYFYVCTYASVSEIFVCHAIYQSVINEIRTRTIVFILGAGWFTIPLSSDMLDHSSQSLFLSYHKISLLFHCGIPALCLGDLGIFLILAHPSLKAYRLSIRQFLVFL